MGGVTFLVWSLAGGGRPRGEGGLNLSVGKGKRWYPAAIATAIYYLREIIYDALQSAITLRFLHLASCNSFLGYSSLRKDFGLLVQVD